MIKKINKRGASNNKVSRGVARKTFVFYFEGFIEIGSRPI